MSSSCNEDENFLNSVVFIAEHNKNGALGFVVNKIFGRPLNELTEFSNSPAFPLYNGGPVDKEHLYFIHNQNDLIKGGSLIINDIYLGGDFKEAVTLINNKILEPSGIKIFIGYCGWDSNELEEEIAEGSWILTDFDNDSVFSAWV